MKLLFIVLPIIGWGIAIIFALAYPLNRRKMATLRSELEQRRGKV